MTRNEPDAGQQVEDTARSVHRDRRLQTLARGGFVISGVLHLLIGWLAVQVALGSGGEDADQGGALQLLSENPVGVVILWLGVVGFAALALWQVLTAALPGAEGSDRAKAAGRAVLYAALTWTAFTVARGGSTDSGEQTQDATATLLAAPLGVALVVVVGLAVVAGGAYHVYKGLSRAFVDDLSTTGGGAVGSGVVTTGVLGYAAKGVALVVVGVLFVVAAVTSDPEESTGLDGAMRTLAEQPYGTVLLIAVGVGVALYGVYSFARARYARM